MADILHTILTRKQQEISNKQARTPLATIIEQADRAPPIRGFASAIESKIAEGDIAVIAEIKQASPSKGILRQHFIPADIAQSYAQHGATCLSVLTDQDFFQGSDAHLDEARKACALPVLRKDFIIDPYQVYESRVLGADCILLIVAALTDDELDALASLALTLDMDVLVEVHNLAELNRALLLNLPLIGVNNRDLTTFDTSLNTTLDLLPYIPSHHTVITESGIHTKADIKLMRDHHVSGFLIGEHFMRAKRPGEALANLLN